MIKVEYSLLLEATKELLKKAGLDNFSVNAVSEGLCETSLRGVDSHGIKLLPHYIESAISGRKNPKPKFKWENKYVSLISLDADSAFGHAAGAKAVEIGIEQAEINGISAVAVKNSSHPGALSCMTLAGARAGFISIAFTHADSLMLSHNGIRPFFGTNPMSISVPRIEKDPYCLDMATSMISWNKLLNHRKNKEVLDENIAADEDGVFTTNPENATSLFPAGGYKGFGLASMVEIFSSLYNGMSFGHDILPMYKTSMSTKRYLGQFYVFLKIDGAISAENFLLSVQSLTDQIRSEPNIGKSSVKMPNDPEIKNSVDRLKNGIPIEDDLYKSLQDLSLKFNINNSFFNQ